ncbi:MAG: hypothetical protein HY532_04920 [Chloroflexi bacterium]|nr:hypothetical protein [Chloroflexota bacterium]
MTQRYAGNRLSGPVLWLAKGSWLVFVVVALVVWSVSYTRFLSEPLQPATEVSDPTVFTLEDARVLEELGLPTAVTAKAASSAFLVLDIAYFAIAGLIFWRRGDDWMALLVSFALVFLGAVVLSYAFEVFSGGPWSWSLLLNILLLAGLVSVALVMYLFPDGRFVPGWTRFAAIASAVLLLSSFLPILGALSTVINLVFILAVACSGVYAQVYRFRRVSTLVQRQQTKWVILGFTWVVAGMVLWYSSAIFFPPERPSPARIYFLLSMLLVGALAGLQMPLYMAIAMLRHKLWDIEVVVNRTLVYAPLSGILMGVYAGSIRMFQALFVQFTGEESDVSILLSTLVLASMFWPLRLRLQALADRYFKEAPNPTRGLHNFHSQVGSFAQFGDVGYVTRRFLDEAVAAFQAQSGAVFLQEGGSLVLAQTTGAWSGSPVINVPIEFGGTQVGQLSLGPRYKARAYTSQDQELLQQTAAAAAQVLSLHMSRTMP